jgi:hypothetical protein
MSSYPPSSAPKKLLGLAAVVLLLTALTASAVEEKRNVVFEAEWGPEYPHYTETFLNAITLDAFIDLPGSGHFHWPCSLQVGYDETECYAGNDSFVVQFYLLPQDGPGAEFEWEQGVHFDVDFTIYHAGWSAGRDIEEDFVPPVEGAPIEILESQVSVVDHGIKCVGGTDIGLFARDVFGPDYVTISLDISDPGDPNLVSFTSSGDRYTSLSFMGDVGPVTRTLDISPLFTGDKIVIEAWVEYPPLFSFSYEASEFLPGVEFYLHKIPWDCSPIWKCRCYYTYAGALQWYEADQTYLSLDMDEDESEDIRFEFAVDNTQVVKKPAQDLAAEVRRLVEQIYPIPGEVDSVIATVENLYDSLCVVYDSLKIHYYLDAGDSPALIGTNTIDDADPRLADFNARLTPVLCDTFGFDPGHPEYLFQKDRCWDGLDLNPRYWAEIEPFPNQASIDNCPGWTVASAAWDTSSNDRAVAGFIPPLPDFAVDSLYVGGPPFLELADACTLHVRVTNKGVDWPVPGSLPDGLDDIWLRGRVFFKWETPLGDTTWIDQIGEVVVTPLGHGDAICNDFIYNVPGPSGPLTVESFPITARFVFEVNGGNAPLDSMYWVCWESHFHNNTFEYETVLTDMPDLAYPSHTRYVTPDSIAQDLPTVNGSSCPDSVYLYVSDPSFVYPLAVPPMRVEIGTGPRDTSPRDSTWSWELCTFGGDYIDRNNRKYKIYVADACCLYPSFADTQSYCFRASLDWSHPDSGAVYLYVDKDGASPVDSLYSEQDTLTTSNVYYLTGAGLLVSGGAAVTTEIGPESGLLVSASPNPVTLPVQLRYRIPAAGHISLEVYDARGRKITVLARGFDTAGERVAEWDGTDTRGRPVADGIYFCRLRAGQRAYTRKLLLLR